MFLLVSDPADALAQAMHRRLAAQHYPVVVLDEAMLFAGTPFVWEQSGREQYGYLRLGEHNVLLSEITGVLLRPPRRWWPSLAFDLQDQTFVYHETLASWFNIFANLPCPVFNRFALGWWLHDPSYGAQLRLEAASMLGITLDDDPDERTITPTSAPPDAPALYAIGGRLLARRASDAALTAQLAEQAPALVRWQHSSGVLLCRLDLVAGDETRLRHIEPFPLLEGEPELLVDQISTALMEYWL